MLVLKTIYLSNGKCIEDKTRSGRPFKVIVKEMIDKIHKRLQYR